jgi:hypothetical protein
VEKLLDLFEFSTIDYRAAIFLIAAISIFLTDTLAG